MNVNPNRTPRIGAGFLGLLIVLSLAGPGVAGSVLFPRRLPLIAVCRQDPLTGLYAQSLVYFVHYPLSGCLVNDQLPCTADSCDPQLGCVHIPNDSLCDDGLFCNGDEQCYPGVGCAAVSACPPAIDGCVTLNGECDEENDICLDVADDSLCDDRDPCTDNVCDLATGDCMFIPHCASADDCSDSLCIIASCDGGCCTAVSACPPSGPTCRYFTGECIEKTGSCVEFTEPDGTACDPATGGTSCENGCDGVCVDGECTVPRLP